MIVVIIDMVIRPILFNGGVYYQYVFFTLFAGRHPVCPAPIFIPERPDKQIKR